MNVNFSWKNYIFYLYVGLLPLIQDERQQGRLIHSILSTHPHLHPMKLRTPLPNRVRAGSKAPNIRYRAWQPKLVFPCTVTDEAPSDGSLLIQYKQQTTRKCILSSECISIITPAQVHFTHSVLSQVALPLASLLNWHQKPFSPYLSNPN